MRQDIEPIKARHEALSAQLRAGTPGVSAASLRVHGAIAHRDRAELLAEVETERRISKMLNDDLNVERQRTENWRRGATGDHARATFHEHRAKELERHVEDLERLLADRFRICPGCKALGLPPAEYLHAIDAPGEVGEDDVWRCASCASVQLCCGCPSPSEPQTVEGYSSYPAVGPSESPCPCDCHPCPEPEW